MGLELEYQEGQTPLDEDEKEGLLIKTVTTHGELDEHEQLNIEKAVKWTIQSKFKPERILTEEFMDFDFIADTETMIITHDLRA